jgi:hypothetical protein
VEKIFTPNKWFVVFCALLVGVVVLLQFVHNKRLEEHCLAFADEAFSWTWEDEGVATSFTGKEAHVLKSGVNDAAVRVKGVQEVKFFTKNAQGEKAKIAPSEGKSASTTSPLQVVVKFYRTSKGWEVGSVEAE